MKLRLDTEDWREQIRSYVPGADQKDSEELDEIAECLCVRVIDRLVDGGFSVDRAAIQSVGNWVIFQHGTDEERAAFDDALEAETKATVI